MTSTCLLSTVPEYDREIARSRQPALDHYATRLKAGAMVLLDDTWRAGEKSVPAEWQKSHGLSLDTQNGVRDRDVRSLPVVTLIV
jgi:hypothetical protein